MEIPFSVFQVCVIFVAPLRFEINEDARWRLRRPQLSHFSLICPITSLSVGARHKVNCGATSPNGSTIRPSALTNSCGFFAGFAFGNGFEGNAIWCHATSCPKWAHGVLAAKTSEKLTKRSPALPSLLSAAAGIEKSAFLRGFTAGNSHRRLKELCHCSSLHNVISNRADH